MRAGSTATALLLLAACAAPRSAERDARAPALEEAPAARLLRRGRYLLADGRLENAAFTAEQALAEHPDSRTREALLFLAGEARYRLGDAEAALRHFETLLADFPYTRCHAVLPVRFFEIGRALSRHPPRRVAGLWPDLTPAVDALSRLVVHYPDSPLADEGWLELARLHRRRGERDLAARALSRLLARAPEGRVLEEALFERARVEFDRFEGAAYDVTPLRRAAADLAEYLRRAGEDGRYAAEARLLLARIDGLLTEAARLRRDFYRRRGFEFGESGPR